ncbi:MAG: hypothetical protein H3C30_08230 [Candidatus Hydrogenedentes bacterium]|nr:hypothetical protein [Candidatus Hydrogenedentota bacterium]
MASSTVTASGASSAGPYTSTITSDAGATSMDSVCRRTKTAVPDRSRSTVPPSTGSPPEISPLPSHSLSRQPSAASASTVKSAP